ncbi:double-strand break repair protein AddB [Chelatococcus sp. SYSU_G07232]|uniref:Double-strand break repair protein AddB n=1 Tax=Chelatococcus albus TaxID=3047466 RepID=A0ABT7AHN3_9HYPH|nr:double-strand break repair protein AddB [Chelatococcus sp. SYSU_G07232]MDJ1158901.1 double-strand break repair protein AddB [Chelatococcus sp. SYSU_G07232]
MTARPSEPRVFTIPPGVPFLATLADALLSGTLLSGFPDRDDPLALAAATIYLPTRRAARAFATHLAERFAPKSVLLPRIVPLGDLDEAELALAADLGSFPESFGTGLPPAIADGERRLVLTRLVLAWARAVDRALLRLGEHEPLLVPASPADAYALAGDLARLMDALATEGVPWDALATLVEERHSRYFAITLAFLKIAAEQWPAILAERGVSDPAARRNALVLAEAARLERERPRTPMIVAGSTGSVPSTARLIAAIARLPNGALVLPGLDRDLDATSWEAIGGDEREAAAPSHPQAALNRLLATLGLAREAVPSLGAPPAAACARSRFLSEALRPAATTQLWASPAHRPDAEAVRAALDGLAIVEAADEREEALAAALALREALEEPERTAALVTPDRTLAERVAAELARWGIAVEDSAGLPLGRSLPGRLARLVAEAASTDFAPGPLLALLAHPLATFGLPRAAAERAAAALEIGLLRGPAPPPGLAGLFAVLDERRTEAQERHAPRPLKRLGKADWEGVADLLKRIEAAFAGFDPGNHAEAAVDLVALVGRHAEVLRAVSGGAAEEAAPAAFAGEAGEALSALFDDIAAAHAAGITGRFADYPAFFAALMEGQVVRRAGPVHRRVKIWGLLEARLLETDRIVLGGLDETVWPPATRTDAFLNRPMRLALGLTQPERRIGQTAHDFVQALGVRDAVVTRAQKRDSAPTVPSRFLQRMRALAGEVAWGRALAAGERYRRLAAALERPRPVAALRRPAPKPPLDLVPRSLSVTEIETLIRDPYAIFAKHVLKLDPLDDLAVPPGAADRGSIIHDALGRFAMAHPGQLPADARERFLAIGEEAFRPLAPYPDVASLWWPRFLRFAEAFLAWERARRPQILRVHAECPGRISIPMPEGEPFVLRARADRIEERRDGGVTIVDFKTGQPPSAPQVVTGFSPQLTLEAAMLVRGGFPGIAAVPDVDLLYVRAGQPEIAPDRPVRDAGEAARPMRDVIEEHFTKLARLIARYAMGEQGFASRPFAEFARRFGPYDHLARIKEWSATGGTGDAGGEP